MLRAHYGAGDRGLTAEELAEAAGYKNHKSANVQYGTFAGRLAKELDVRVYPNLAILGTWDHEVRNRRGHLLFPMRPQVAYALEALEWVIDPSPQLDLDPEITATEGRLSLLMRQRARESRLREAKIEDAIARSGDGRLRCEVPGCGFDFEAIYGELGARYAQVHHLAQLAATDRPRANRLKDLAIVCANCHAMIHRRGGNRPLKSLIPSSRRAAPNQGPA